MIRCEYFDNQTAAGYPSDSAVGQIVLQPNHSLSWKALIFPSVYDGFVVFHRHCFPVFRILAGTALHRSGDGRPELLPLALSAPHQPAEVITFGAEEIRLKSGIDSQKRQKFENVFTKNSRQSGRPSVVSQDRLVSSSW